MRPLLDCSFTRPADWVDPVLVPKRILYTGAEIPAIGLGTFGSDHVSPERIAEAVEGAIAVGFRHLNCASVYGNEKAIGRVITSSFSLLIGGSTC